MNQTERSQIRILFKAISDPIAPQPSRYEYGREAALALMFEAAMTKHPADAERAWKRVCLIVDYGWMIQRKMQDAVDELRRRTNLSMPEILAAKETAAVGLRVFHDFVGQLANLASRRQQ